MPRPICIEVGQRYGRWVVLQKMPSVKCSGVTVAKWLCRCDCGKEGIVSAGNLFRKKSASCGCLRTELLVKRSRTHGESYSSGITVEYRAWLKMLSRCYNPNDKRYPHYGGRGIEVCERWRHSFENFLADKGRKPSPYHSLDRINTNGNYAPENTKWSTQKEQQNNRRNNNRLTVDGIDRTLAQWEEVSGLNRGTIAYRVKCGMDVKEAIFRKAGEL